MKLHALAVTALVVVAGTSGCSSGPSTPEPGDGGRTNPLLAGASGEAGEEVAQVPAKGFVWTIAEGQPQVAAEVRVVGAAKPLDEAATKALLGRMPAVGAEAGDKQDFALRPASTPPPTAGDKVVGAFPPAAGPPVVAPDATPKALEVLRFQPEGDVPVAPRISVTFSTPMVALTSHAELAKDAVPARITPDISGHWRWVGTKTLFFEPDGRAPMATDYAVEIPAGVIDALGQRLAAAKRWTFSTPPPKLIASRPDGEGVALDPVFFALFDQRVDPKAVLQHLAVTAGGKRVALRELNPDELKGVPEVGNADLEGRWVAYKATAELPRDAAVTATFAGGMPSAEGPRKTAEPQSFGFKTYGPFEVSEHRCGWGECRPLMPWSIRFTNPVDEGKLTAAMIEVSPQVPGFEVDVYGQELSLRGMTRGRTTYTVRLSKELLDVYGQKLGASKALTFEVGPSEKMMGAPDTGLVILDPTAKKPRFSVFTMNYEEVDVALYRVTPEQWVAYNDFQVRWRQKDGPKEPPGTRVFSERVPTGGAPEQLNELAIDLAPALEGGRGQIIVFARPVGAEDEWREQAHTVLAWVQATGIGLDAFSDGSELVGWATSLADGTPLAGVNVTLMPQKTAATTDADGLVRLALPPGSPKRQLLVATSGQDVAFLPDDSSYWSSEGSWVRRTDEDEVRWLVFDDRQLYRPDETISVKGFVRVIEKGVKGDVAALGAGVLPRVRWKIVGPRGNDIGEGESAVDRFGGFTLSYKLPKTPNLGYASIQFTAALPAGYTGAEHHHSFRIEEFRRPEFEVSAKASEGPHFVGGSATMTVSASYFAGGALPGADVSWSVSAQPGSFSPPQHADWIFGTWIPWWEFERGGQGGGEGGYQSLDGLTDGSGKHTIKLDFTDSDPPKPMSVRGEATVQDVNRQAWSASATVLVHPAKHYVGLRTPKPFVGAEEPIKIEAIVADLDGQRIVGSDIAVELVRLAWKRNKAREWAEVEVEPQTCTVKSAKDAAACTFTTKVGGTHRVRATIADADGRKNQTSMLVWVAGGKQPESSKLEQEQLTLIPSGRDFQPGQVAEILVQSPFAPADGVLRIVRGDHAEVRRFHLDGPTTTLKIPIEEWMIPGFTVNVNVNGSAERSDADGAPKADLPRRPAFAAGSLTLRVPPTLRTLAVELTPAAAKTEPGAKTRVTVLVKDAAGQPVANAGVALVAVDEAVLALTGYTVPTPVDLFYTLRGDATQARMSRSHLVLANLADLLAQAEQQGLERNRSAKMAEAMPAPAPSMAAPMEGRMEEADMASAPGGDKNGAAAPIAVRKNFDPLAVFAPEVVTDAQGRAVVPVALPDNLTRYRVFAVAVAGPRQFGASETAVTARLPLMVRLSPPRFLNFGDRFELPVVVQNQTDAPLEVDVAVRATNANLTAGQGRRVQVPANDRVEVRFPAEADMAGTARFQAGASSGAWADAAEVSLPVWTPATTEAFATYGEIDQGAIAQPVQTPGEVWPQFGGLDVTTSSTQLQALTDAVLYLTAYPFECAEQVSSRVMSVAALKDVLAAFKAEGLPSPEAMIAAVARDLDKLRGMQNGDGGWGFWRRGLASWPFLTVHVTHALARASEKGFAVASSLLDPAVYYLQKIEDHFPADYGPEIRRVIRAYALYVLDRLGKGDPAKARAIAKEAGSWEKLGLESVGWLYPTLSGKAGYESDVAEIRRLVGNSIRETAGLAHFTTSYADGAHLVLHSDRRVDGLLLEALIKDQPQSDLIPKIVRGLLGHRTKGRWGNTQESAWVLLALDRYFATYEKVEPNFVARVWLGQDFAGEHTFKGRTTEQHEIGIPMSWLAKVAGPQPLTVAKDGPGRLYYRLGMRYAPKSLALEPADHGFTVERTYKGVEKPEDVKKNADGSWTIKAGALVEVQVTMFTQDRRYHVALVDPLPAGLEALNPALLGTTDVAARTQDKAQGGDRWWWWGPWYEHQNLRDERAEAFTSLLWDGVYTYSYVARATTPGRFVVPPPKAEEMYHPETFGRGATDFVTVE